MKVGELIEVLKTYPQDLEVLTWDCEYGYNPISKAIIITVVESSDTANNYDLVTKYDISTATINVGQKFVGISFID